MSKYGAKYGRWARFSGAEPKDSKPVYGPSMSLGPLNKASDSPTFASADLYGDDALKHHKDKFSKATVSYTSTNLPLETAAAIYGATISEDKRGVSYGDDEAPLGGLAFFCELDDEVTGKTVFRGVCYPKLRAVKTGEEFASVGDSLTFTPDEISFTAALPNYGKWKETYDFDTEVEAREWVDKMLSSTSETPPDEPPSEPPEQEDDE